MPLRRSLLIAAIASAAVALPAAAADASRSGHLSLTRANRVADKTASGITDSWQGTDGTQIDDYELAGCERVSTKEASCDVTYTMDDQSTCDDTIHVTALGAGRFNVTSDSDDGATQTFGDCYAPEPDPSATDSTDGGGDYADSNGDTTDYSPPSSDSR
ncbi:MAG TPA: hypothetical protein VIL64_05370 [Solirubrobacteraceae bacterium]